MEYEEQFERDFMKRTLSLLHDHGEPAGPYGATLLLNCLLGLLVVPKEKSFEKIPTDPISDLRKWGISPSSIKSPRTKAAKNTHPGTIREFVCKLRHAVAHFDVTPLGQDGKCTGFVFAGLDEFTAAIDLGELREFVENLAEHLLSGDLPHNQSSQFASRLGRPNGSRSVAEA